jgi:hypothetical protein
MTPYSVQYISTCLIWSGFFALYGKFGTSPLQPFGYCNQDTDFFYCVDPLVYWCVATVPETILLIVSYTFHTGWDRIVVVTEKIQLLQCCVAFLSNLGQRYCSYSTANFIYLVRHWKDFTNEAQNSPGFLSHHVRWTRVLNTNNCNRINIFFICYGGITLLRVFQEQGLELIPGTYTSLLCHRYHLLECLHALPGQQTATCGSTRTG